MKRLSIEQALVWAYREQMVHVALPQGVPVEASQGYSPALSEGRFLADKVDSGVIHGFAAHADAYAIHRQVQRLEPVVLARGADELEMLFARRLLKNDFDSLDRRAAGDASRPSPTVDLLPRQIVQIYALSATRPDRVDAPEVVFERGKRVHTDRFGRVVMHPTKFGFFMLNVVGDDPLEVIAHRRLYAVWHAALSGLLDSLVDLKSVGLTKNLPPAPVDD